MAAHPLITKKKYCVQNDYKISRKAAKLAKKNNDEICVRKPDNLKPEI